MSAIPVIPAFQIEGVHLNLTDSPWSDIKDLTAGEYDDFIKTQPEAKLKYFDEDGDEVIVGSAAELLDRISEFELGGPIVFQTINSRGVQLWFSYLANRSGLHEAKKEPKAGEKKVVEQTPEQSKEPKVSEEEEVKTAEPERPKTPEETEADSLFAAFQRDLAQALRESLEYPYNTSSQEQSSSSSTSNDTHPHPSVERFLRQLSETIQSSLQSVYPAAANVTTALRTNPALRQAAEALQSVGHQANHAIHHTDKKKIAEELRDEVKVAMKNVGTALGEAFAEIGDAYVQAYKQINEEVVKIINVTRGSGTSTPAAAETTTTEEQTQVKESVVENKEPVVEEEQTSEVKPDSSTSTAPKRDLKPTVEEEKEAVPEKSTTTTTATLEQITTDETPSLSELERALHRAEAQRLERLRTSPPMPGTFSVPESLLPAKSSPTTSSPSTPAPRAPAPRAPGPPAPPAPPAPFQHARTFSPFSNRFGSFAGSYARPQGRGQIFMGPRSHQSQSQSQSSSSPTTSHQHQSSTSPSHQSQSSAHGYQTQSQAVIEREEDQTAADRSFEEELRRGLEASLRTEEEEQVARTVDACAEEVDVCVARLCEMGYDQVFDAERVRAVALVAEGVVEVAIEMLMGE